MQKRNSASLIGKAVRPAIELLENRHMLSAALSLSSSLLVFNAVKNSSPSQTETLTLSNTGDAALSLGSGAIQILNDPNSSMQEAARFSVVNASSIPATLAAGASFGLQLNYSAQAVETDPAVVDITTNDPVNPVQVVNLHGIGTKGLGGSNQPSLATILQAYDIPTYVGDGPDDSNALQDNTYPYPPDPTSQEVVLQRLVKAGPGPVTIHVLASFTASGTKPYALGTYTPGDPSAADLNELFFTPTSESQSVYVQPQGATSFDPGTSQFGFYCVSNVQVKGRLIYTEDALNTFDSTTGRHFRFFPMETPAGTVVPNEFIMTSTEWNAPIGYDFTNIVAIVSNIKAATGAPDGPVMGLQNLNAVPGSSSMVFDRIQSPNTTVGDTVHDTGMLQVNNTGDQPLILSSYTLSSPWELVNPPTFPVTVAAGKTLDLSIKFIAQSEPSVPYNETNSDLNGGGGGVYDGTFTLNGNDPNTPTATVPLRGWWQLHSENDNEPGFETIANLLYGWGTYITSEPTTTLPESLSTTNSVPTYYGEEVVSAYWEEADPSTGVTVQQIAAYHTEGNTATTYYFNKGGSSNKLYVTGTDVGQTLFPTLSNGSPATATFSDTGEFGFRVDSEYSDDTLNSLKTGGGHHFRFYPVRDADDNLVPNTYIMTMDYGTTPQNFDFQDNVWIVSNIRPAIVNTGIANPQTTGAPAAPTDLHVTNSGGINTLQWAPVADSSLVGYDVYRASSATGTYTLLNPAPTAATSYVDSTAPGSGTSYYKVEAVDSNSTQSLGDRASVLNSGGTPGDPVAAPESASTAFDTAVTINVAVDATDVSGTIVPSTVAISAAPANGTTSINPTTGAITYTPSTGFSGTDTFQYTIGDSTGATSAPATVSITVLAQGVGNPVAPNLTFTVKEGTPLVIDDVSQATDSGGTLVPSSVTVTEMPVLGTATVNTSNGSITYNATTTGTDTFQYTISDSTGAVSAPATITVTVNPPGGGNPVAANISISAIQNVPLVIDDAAQATDTTGIIDPTSVVITQFPADGNASVNASNGAITYIANSGYTGTDTIGYTIADNLGTVSNPATITITVGASGPAASSFTTSAATGIANTINVISSATDPTGNITPGGVTITTTPAHGSASTDGAGNIIYTPAAGYFGTDSLQYTLTDSNGIVSPAATLSLNVGVAINDTTSKSLKFTDNLGNLVTIALTGGGTGLVFFNGTGSAQSLKGPHGTGTVQVTGTGLSISNITVAGSTITGLLSISRKGTALVELGGLSVADPIGRILAPTTNLTGTLAVTGAVSQIQLASATNATLTIGSAQASRAGMSLVGGHFVNTSLGSAIPIASIKVIDWTVSEGGDSISAPSISSLVTTGDLQAAITLAHSPFGLGSWRIGGQVDAQGWNVTGEANNVVVGSIAVGWTGTFADLNTFIVRGGGFAGTLYAAALNSLSITGNDTGAITAGKINSVRVAGQLSGAALTLTSTVVPKYIDLGRLTVTGGVVHSTIVSAGNIGSITTAGISGSSVDAGTAAGINLPTTSGDFTASATLSSFTVVGKGSQFINSNIGAALIGSLNLGDVITGNGSVPFGIGAAAINSLSATLDNDQALRLKKTNLLSSSSILAYLAAHSLSLGDFQITPGL